MFGAAITVSLPGRHGGHTAELLLPAEHRVGSGGPPLRADNDATAVSLSGRQLYRDESLAIAHDITVAHGGTIEVESTSDAGTTFRISLPIAGT